MEKLVASLQEQEQRLMDKTFEVSERISRMEEHDKHLDRSLEEFSSKLEEINKNLTIDLPSSVSKQIAPIEHLVAEHEKTQNDIVQLQKLQSRQIESINNSLQEFAKIREQVAAHEARIVNLESDKKTEAEIKKEKVKGTVAIITGVISAVAGILTAIITSVVR